MNTSTLTTLRTDQVTTMLETKGLCPGDFEWTVAQSEFSRDTVVSRLLHRGSVCSFLFDVDEHGRPCHVFTNPAEGRPRAGRASGWPQQLRKVGDWVDAIVFPAGLPRSIGASAPIGMGSGGIAGKQFAILETRMDEIYRAGISLGRKDLINLSAGLVAGQVVQVACPPARTEAMWNDASTIVASTLQQIWSAVQGNY